MNLPQLIDAANACLSSLDAYAAARTALVSAALSARDLAGGPWQSRFTRERGEGQVLFTGVFAPNSTGAAATEGQARGGPAMLHDDNPHAPFRGFQLIDAAGNPPAAGTDAEVVQLRYGFYLAKTGEEVNALLSLLPLIECVHVNGADTQPLTQLRTSLPKPPYLPIRERTIMGRFIGAGGARDIEYKTENERGGVPLDKWVEVVAEEAKLIDAARVGLNRLVVLAQREDFGPAAQMSIPAAAPTPFHSKDFTFVDWYGAKYTFTLGVQTSAVEALWKEWETTGFGLHQSTIAKAVDAARENFRIDKAFRNHPALGTMIRGNGKGVYRLVPPGTCKSTPKPK